MAADRIHPRIPAVLEVEFRTAGAFLVAYSVNLSKGGIFLETSTFLPLGTEVALRFNVPDEGVIDVRGVVAWTRTTPEPGKPRGMGIEFGQLDERYGEAIDRIVSNFAGLQVLVLAASAQARRIASSASLNSDVGACPCL